MGTKIFIDFTKYDFLECSDRLLKEIKECTEKSTVQVQSNVSKEKTIFLNENFRLDKSFSTVSSPIKNNNLILNWTEDDVDKWLSEKQVNSQIAACVKPCNGMLLNQYYDMQSSCPEFFYNSISSNKQISFRDVAHFGCELKKLFQN